MTIQHQSRSLPTINNSSDNVHYKHYELISQAYSNDCVRTTL